MSLHRPFFILSSSHHFFILSSPLLRSFSRFPFPLCGVPGSAAGGGTVPFCPVVVCTSRPETVWHPPFVPSFRPRVSAAAVPPRPPWAAAGGSRLFSGFLVAMLRLVVSSRPSLSPSLPFLALASPLPPLRASRGPRQGRRCFGAAREAANSCNTRARQHLLFVNQL